MRAAEMVEAMRAAAMVILAAWATAAMAGAMVEVMRAAEIVIRVTATGVEMDMAVDRASAVSRRAAERSVVAHAASRQGLLIA